MFEPMMQSHLSIPADLNSLVVIPWVEDVLSEGERKTLFMDPLYTENSSKAHEAPVLAALLANDRCHASVTLQTTHLQWNAFY